MLKDAFWKIRRNAGSLPATNAYALEQSFCPLMFKFIFKVCHLFFVRNALIAAKMDGVPLLNLGNFKIGFYCIIVSAIFQNIKNFFEIF